MPISEAITRIAYRGYQYSTVPEGEDNLSPEREFSWLGSMPRPQRPRPRRRAGETRDIYQSRYSREVNTYAAAMRIYRIAQNRLRVLSGDVPDGEAPGESHPAPESGGPMPVLEPLSCWLDVETP